MVGPGAGSAARRRDRGRPGHRHRQPTAVAGPRAPGDVAPPRRRRDPVAGRTAGVLPQLAGVPGAVAGAGASGRWPVRRASGRGDVARLQRAGLPQRALLLRRQRRGVPRLAAGALRRRGPAQRRLGHRVLEPALRRLGRDQPAAYRADLRQPHAATRLPALLLRRAARPVARRTGGAADVGPAAGHHQLHDRYGRQAHGLPLLGRRRGPRLQRPLPDRRRPAGASRAGARRRPHPGRRRRRPVVAHGALDQRGQLAAAQRGQTARTAAPQQPGARRPGRGRGAVLPVARLPGRRREVPLRAGAARRTGHQGVPRGLPARRGPQGPRGGTRQSGGRRGGDPVRLGSVVGDRVGFAPQRRRHVRRPAGRPPRGAVAGRRDRRHRPPVGGPQRLPTGPGTDPLPGAGRRRRGAAPLRRGRWQRGRHLLQRHRRRERPHPAGRLPGRVP